MAKQTKAIHKFSLKKLFGKKQFAIPFSIVLAFILWLVIMINQYPDVERTFTDIPVSINLENTYVSENGMEIIGDLSTQKFTVTVVGPSYVVSTLDSTDFSVYASAAAINEPGKYDLDVSTAKRSNITDYEISNISPATVSVTFDYIETKEFTIKATAEGATAKKGLITETAVVSGTESDTITIKGPRTVINQIDSVVAYAKVNKTLSESSTFDANIHLYDEKEKEISTKNLTLSTTQVQVTVPIVKRASVPVVAQFANLPSGFLQKSITYTMDHKTVKIVGAPATINGIKQVTLTPIDLTSVSTKSNKFDVAPKLPDGVRLLDSIDTVTVTIDTSNYEEKLFTISNMRFNNLSSGLTASGQGSVKNVKICGPATVINQLTDSMLYAEVDLTDKVAGEHTVEISVKSDKHHDIWQIGSYSTTVKIE